MGGDKSDAMDVAPVAVWRRPAQPGQGSVSSAWVLGKADTRHPGFTASPLWRGSNVVVH